LLTLYTTQLSAQKADPPVQRIDLSTLGVGFGLEYAGIGVNFTTSLHKNIAIFGSVGMLYDFEFSTGIKARLISEKKISRINPFVVGMYGVNTVVAYKSLSPTSKSSYNSYNGISCGIGMDFSFNRRKTGYWSAALLVPLTISGHRGHVSYSEWKKNTSFKSQSLPALFSIGYKIILQSRALKEIKK